jgi:FHA domain
MNSKIYIYFMMLVGALAGLTSWVFMTVVVGIFPGLGQPSFLDLLNMGLLGMFICGLSVAFNDYWSDGEYQILWIAVGALLGMAIGLVSGLGARAIQSQFGVGFPLASRLIPWTLTGALIGFGAGARWFKVNLFRPAMATLGGMAGAAVGGLVYTVSGQVHALSDVTDFVQATAFILTGVGVTAGVTLAPNLMVDGVIRFVASQDRATRERCQASEWPLRQGGRLLIGRLSLDESRHWYGKEVSIYLPDREVSERHAYVVGDGGQYFIEDADGAPARTRSAKVLQVNGQPVRGSHHLQHGDTITIGRTQMRFEERHRATRT